MLFPPRLFTVPFTRWDLPPSAPQWARHLHFSLRLTGSKALSSDLWFFSVPPSPIPRALHTALFSLASLPAARFVAYHHRSFGSLSLSTFLRALSRGHIHGIPLLTHTIARKFLLSLATAYGHLDTLRQGVASTRRTPPHPCLSVASNASLTPTTPLIQASPTLLTPPRKLRLHFSQDRVVVSRSDGTVSHQIGERSRVHTRHR